MANTALDGKPYAGNPHVRIDEGDGASAKPRRSSLLYNVVKACLGTILGLLMCGGAWAGVPLPGGYQRLEWISVPNGAYVNTGFKPTKDTHTIMKVNVAGGYEYWFGCWKGFGNNAYALANGNDKMNICYGDEAENVYLDTPSGRVEYGIHTVELDKNVAKIDGVAIKTFSPPESIAGMPTSYTMYLFSQNRSGTANRPSGQGTLICYYCQIFEDGTLIHDYIPCRDPNQNAGLWDRVDGKFCGNNGSGTISGSDACDLYLNWMRSAKGMGIDTGFKPTAYTHTVMKVNVTSGFEYWFGFRKNWGDHCYLLLNGNDKMNIAYGNEAQNVYLSTPSRRVEFGIHTVELDKNVAKIDGETVYTFSSPESIVGLPTGGNMYFLAENRNGSLTQNGGAITCYFCRMYDNDVLIRDFRPQKAVDGTLRYVDAANGNQVYAWKGKVGETSYGFSYLPETIVLATETNQVINVYDGKLEAEDLAGYQTVAKVGPSTLDASGVTGYPALSVLGGELAFTNNAPEQIEVEGALTFRNRARVTLDLTAAGVDHFTAGALAFDTDVSVDDPVIVHINDVTGRGRLNADEVLPFLSVAGTVLTADDAVKFRVEGLSAEVAVENGVLVLRAISENRVVWTGSADDALWSTVGNWQDENAPTVGSEVLFNLAAGDQTTFDLPGLSIRSVSFGAESGAFTVDGTDRLTILNSITNSSSALQTLSLPLQLGVSGNPLAINTVGDLAITGGVKSVLADTLAKMGAGTLWLDDDAVAQAANVRVEAGMLRLVNTGRTTSASTPGEIHVLSNACLDVNVLNAGASLARNEATHGKTVYVAGDGLDGEGAILNTVTNVAWGCNFSRIVLTGDASLGGEGFLNVRALAGSAQSSQSVEGAHTLTVKTDGSGLALFYGTAFALDRIDLRGRMAVEEAASGAITNGIHCFEGSYLQFNSAAVLTAAMPLVAEAGELTWKCSGAGDRQVAGAVTIKPGVSLSIACADETLTFSGAVTSDGAVVQSDGGEIVLAGPLSGVGAFTGAGVRFGGNSSWSVRADDTGLVETIDFSGVENPDLFVGLRSLSVVYTGTTDTTKRIVLGAAGNLTREQVLEIALTVENAQGGSVANCYLTVEDGKFTLVVADHLLPRYATWTGNGDDPTNLADPANWSCSNDLGQLLPEAAPMYLTTIRISAGCTLNVPAGATLVYHDFALGAGASLAADCDWSGLDLAQFLPGGTLDLAGHTVQVATKADLLNGLTITDSTTVGGTFRIMVPADTAIQNSTVTLAGSLKFAKAGAGTLNVNKFGQTYTGGTEIEGGVLTMPVSGSASTAYSPRNRQFGALGSSITVDRGATFDMKGNYEYYQHPIVLNGGTLANTGCDMTKMFTNGWSSIGNVTLLADSFCTASFRTRFTEGLIDLGGHKLTVTSSASYFHLDGNADRHANVTNGTLVVEGSCLFNSMGTPNYSFVRDMRTVDLVLSCPLSTTISMQVRNLTESCTINNGYNTGKIFIYGVYTPISGYIFNFEMQDGSTLNLKDKTTAWSANPDPALTKCNTLAFAEGARISVDLTGRSLHSRERVVSWDVANPPANVNTVHLKLIGSLGSLSVEEDGIYINKGLILIFK